MGLFVAVIGCHVVGPLQAGWLVGLWFGMGRRLSGFFVANELVIDSDPSGRVDFARVSRALLGCFWGVCSNRLQPMEIG